MLTNSSIYKKIVLIFLLSLILLTFSKADAKNEDVIISINGGKGDWKNLTSSLKFSSLGNDIIFEILTNDNNYKTIEIRSSEIKELTR